VYTGIAQGVLSQKVAMAVLERYTINVKTRKEIWRCATTDGEPPWYKHTWLRLNQYGLDVEHHVSEIMHLLFLGIVKKFINLIMRWAVGSSRGAVLERALDKACCACNKLHLDKLQSHPYTAIGGWVLHTWSPLSRKRSGRGKKMTRGCGHVGKVRHSRFQALVTRRLPCTWRSWQRQASTRRQSPRWRPSTCRQLRDCCGACSVVACSAKQRNNLLLTWTGASRDT
jgi:hypothetical protein